jgi:hypothetical protein
MRRRCLLRPLALTWTSALAEVSTLPPLIALLLGGSQATVERWLGGFPEELNALGYVEHRDYEIEYRFADGSHTFPRPLRSPPSWTRFYWCSGGGKVGWR